MLLGQPNQSPNQSSSFLSVSWQPLLHTAAKEVFKSIHQKKKKKYTSVKLFPYLKPTSDSPLQEIWLLTMTCKALCDLALPPLSLTGTASPLCSTHYGVQTGLIRPQGICVCCSCSWESSSLGLGMADFSTTFKPQYLKLKCHPLRSLL